jgi:hypothetical protein
MRETMHEVTLASAPEEKGIDALLCEIVARFEAAFPGRVRAYSVIGSYGDASNLPTSDLDLDIVLR